MNFADRTLTARLTKNGVNHTIPLSGYVFDCLSNRYWYLKPNADDYVFPGRTPGKPLSECYKGYERLWAQLGYRFMLHDLRRTFLTTGESLDISMPTLKRLANHRTNSDVTCGYIVLTPDRLREPIERIAARLIELGKL